MRLWHEKLIPYLPRQQLLGQHRECCALRGNGWGRKHATIDYVFKHDPMWLAAYHFKVLNKMYQRGYNFNDLWSDRYYRGQHCSPYTETPQLRFQFREAYLFRDTVYPEHNDEYLKECLNNLERKGIHIEMRNQHAD